MVWQVTLRGVVKCTPALSFKGAGRKSGVRSIDLDAEDRLVAAFSVPNQGQDTDVVIATANGMVIRFSTEEVRAMGRALRGVRGINLCGDGFNQHEDAVATAFPIDASSGNDLVGLATERGYAVRFPAADLRRHGRGTKGVIARRTNDVTGPISIGTGLLPSGEVTYSTAYLESRNLPWAMVPIRPRNVAEWFRLQTETVSDSK